MGVSKQDLPVAMEVPGMYEGRLTEQDGTVVAYESIAATDPAPLYRGLPDDRCPAHHHGFLFKGKLIIRYVDREEEVTAGQAYVMEPGHLPLIVEDVELVEFTPKAEYDRLMDQIGKNLQSAGIA